MSNALAIAAVTETLRDLLSAPVANAVNGALVGTFSPDDTNHIYQPGVNIFLYQVSPNAALRNADLPTRNRQGGLLRKPQAAIDLHYLLTFYGQYAVLEPQRLLGAVTETLHADPVLSVSRIQAVQANTPFLAGSNLDTQTELIKFTPIAFTLEELSKLWSFLLKVDYVLSTAYVASVVLIEDDDKQPLPPPLPALAYRLTAQPLQQPVITSVLAWPNTSPPNTSAPITAGSQIALKGNYLTAPSGGATQVLIGGVTQTPASIGVSQITLTLPPHLAAGPQTAQVMQPAVLGVPPVVHPGTGAASGIATFVLTPMIAPASPPGSFAIGPGQPTGSPPTPTVVATLIPTVQAGQRVLLQLLPQASPPAGAQVAGLLFDGGTLTAPSDTVTFPVPNLPSGQYLARVLVDGAQSPLVLGYGNLPIGPLVSL